MLLKFPFWRRNPCSSSRSPHPGVLALFAYLQFLDLLTTVVFLAHGVREANPLVRLAILAAGSPLAALLLLKAAAVAAAFYCTVAGRMRLLRRVNVVFGALVVWNLVALVAA